MLKQEDDRTTEQREYIAQIYQNKASVEAILKKLDFKWKSGDSIELDKVLNRYEALMVFFQYLVRKDSEKISFLEKLELLDTEEADFLDNLANQFSNLEKPFRNYILSRRGAINHLSRISIGGVYYNPDIQTVQAGFSLYTFDSRVLETKDDIDDFIWLSEGILEVVINALEECRDKSSPISQEYVDILKVRFKSMDEKYSKLKELIDALDSTSDSSLDLSEETPTLDISASEE